MPRDNSAPGTPREWLARSRGDLALARLPLPEEGFYEDLCFHAQQAAEKAIKAVILYHGWTFRYVHDLDELITSIEQQGVNVPAHVRDAVDLTPYAFEARYPGVSEPVTEEEYAEALERAEHVVSWARGVIEGEEEAETNK